MFSSNTTQVDGEYLISRSLRFNKFGDAPYLLRTNPTASNRKTFTISAWVKASTSGDYNGYNIYAARNTGPVYSIFQLAGSQATEFTFRINDSTNLILETAPLFRDPAAWYHVVFAVDTTQATAANRAKIYVNGVQITSFATATYPSQNADTQVNNNIEQVIGGFIPSISTIDSWDGYMTEVYLIDGQALTAASFGAINPTTGVWGPTAYSGGSYGTNGFYINFSDNSNTTAATLGKDYSGNGNNYTPFNFSVTAGIGNDSMVDVPTSYGLIDTGAGGTVRGNYATLNPLKKHSYSVMRNGNLTLRSQYGNAPASAVATISPSSGYYYWEMTCSGSNASRPWGLGFAYSYAAADSGPGTPNTVSVSNGSGTTTAYYVGASLTATLSTAAAWADGDIISVAWDSTSTINKVWVGRNGVWYPSTNGGTAASNADVAAGNFPTFTLSNVGNTDPVLVPMFGTYDTAPSIDVNFGQRPFSYTAPSGFKCLCAQNLPTPAVGGTAATLSNKFFNPVLWTGNGALTRSITGVGFQPDFSWIKNRSGSISHALFNSIVGGGANKGLASNNTDSEAAFNDNATYGYLSSFDSDGLSVVRGTDGASSYTNANALSYVAWNWKGGGTGVSNTSGSITSTVSASTTSGFSVVTYSGNGSNSTVGHGLGVAPKFIILKQRNQIDNWLVYSEAIGAANFLRLNTDGASTAGSPWQSTTPTSSVVYLGSGSTSQSGTNYVMYCFAPIAGYSAFGSYTGNGSTDGPFVLTGFRPAWILFKGAGAGTNWFLFDSKRSPYNIVINLLYPNAANAENTAGSGYVDFLSNGFRVKTTAGDMNANGGTYTYVAFAENPFKTSIAR
jgi:hypothetical protein